MIWTDAQGVTHEINKMATPHIENCLSFLDERIATLIKRGHTAYSELSRRREVKREMMRVLESRRSRIHLENETPNLTRACGSCKHSNYIIITFGQGAELICNKLGFTCKTVNFTCGAWEKKANGEK